MKNFLTFRKQGTLITEQTDEPASPDEAGMAMDQAKFIGYVAEEIKEYISGNKEFPEWMQNKLTGLHEKAKDMHAVMAGKYNESVEEAVKQPSDKDLHKTLGPTKNIQQGIEALKKAYKMSDDEAKKHIRRLMGEAKKYTAPTKAEIEADKKKDRAGKSRPSMSDKSAKKSVYKNMMGGLKEEVDEAMKFSDKQIKMAYGIINDPRYKSGNMTAIVNKIEQIAKGLSKHPGVVKAIKVTNESVDLAEKLTVADGMKKWIDDFQKSDAPQFQGKSEKERREMAIAAYMAAKKSKKK